MQTELRWIQRPFTELFRLAWPIAVSMLSLSVMSIVDTYFVSGLGADALAGVGLASTAMFTLVCFSNGLLRSIKVLVSQAVGAGRAADAPLYLSGGLVLAGGFGLLAVLLSEIIAPHLGSLSATVEAGQHATTYLRIRSLSAPCFLVFIAVREFSYGRGESRLPMMCSLMANVCNAILCYAFVGLAGLGVAGAAVATVIACTLEMSLLLWARWSDLARLARPRLSAIAALWRVGVPTGVQFGLEVGALALLAALLSMLSEVEMAAHQLVFHLLMLAFLPTNAIAEAGSVQAGQAVGANRDDLVPGVARRVLVMASTYGALCTAILLLFGRDILAAFTSESALATVALRLVHIAAVFLIVDGANMVARGILRGTGDVRYPAVICILCSWVCTPPLTWLLGYRAGLGAAGGWIGLCLEVTACAALLWWRLRRGSWLHAAACSRAHILSSASSASVDTSQALPVAAGAG